LNTVSAEASKSVRWCTGWVEAGGAGFGAVDQGAGRLGHGHKGQQAGSEEQRFEDGSFHGDP